MCRGFKRVFLKGEMKEVCGVVENLSGINNFGVVINMIGLPKNKK